MTLDYFLPHYPRRDEDHQLAFFLPVDLAFKQPADERDVGKKRDLGVRNTAVNDEDAADNRGLAVREKDLRRGFVFPNGRLTCGAQERRIRCVFGRLDLQEYLIIRCCMGSNNQGKLRIDELYLSAAG